MAYDVHEYELEIEKDIISYASWIFELQWKQKDLINDILHA